MRTVKLRLFQDDASGTYGLAHSNAIDRGFNAFWNGIGIFHDVFEHWFEDTHPYFLGDYAFNIGGEVAAMGASLYYYGPTGLYDERKLSPQNIHSYETNCVYTTYYEMLESVTDATFRFGNRFLSAVPDQKPGPYMLESMIDDHQYMIEEMKKEREVCSDHRKQCIAYKRSLTSRRLRNLYRWGWYMAEQHANDLDESYPILSSFIKDWEKFCKNTDAKMLHGMFRYLVFEVQTEGIPSWTAHFIPHYGYGDEPVHWKDAEEFMYADPYA